ncbi:ABC transporter permease [Myxococcus sp. RHSTA-1-4]|uniref:ABC transporter permease n=1 Tax=Myxococcus sp. RHSTA-1-4 TaxID=2874601 RepID=UPI001CBCFDC7|nr:ABC transporter permease [Myxococcus sp. RHSTA-1-4]
MRALERKLLRDLSRLKGQGFTIALVVAAGIAAYVSTLSVYRSLSESQRAYYERSRFADVFVRLERAPDALLERLEVLPGVAEVEARQVEDVTLDMPGLPEPVVGRILSVPGSGAPPRLNQLHLRRGRWVEPGRANEVLVNEGFAKAHRLEPGDTVMALVNGRRVALRVVGVVLSPEYIFALAPGSLFDDDRRFGIFWMDRDTLASAFRMEGAFNDLVVRLAPGARAEDVVAALDRELVPYGGFGAYPRARQTSDRFVSNEIVQLRANATIVPLIFLGVAAFLVNVVLSRVVGTQREQIAALKALGYSNGALAAHYLELVGVVVGLGSLLGVALGAWMGRALLGVYMDVFRFPLLAYRLDAGMVAGAVLVSAVSASVGALAAVRQTVRLPPAEAMRPAAPPSYRPTPLERVGFHALFSQGGRMVLRDLERRPWRLLLTSLGIALAVAILIVGRFSGDALRYLMDVQYGQVQREDLAVAFTKSVPDRARRELEMIPGVRHTEPMRVVPVRLVAGPRRYETAIQGLPPEGGLRRVMDTEGRPVPLRGEGLLLGTELARRLGVGLGDAVRVEVLDAGRTVRDARVTGLVEEWLGTSAYMDLTELARLVGDDRVITGATLVVDRAQQDGVYARLKALPWVASVTRADLAKELFREQSERFLTVLTFILGAFASAIAVGIVYNNARVALAVRSRDLATLRVLGFTRREISLVLLGEMAVGLLLALPLGMVLGKLFAEWVARAAVDSELYRIPAIVAPPTYATAVLVVLVAGILSALLVRRRLDHLDLIGVLKTRE